MKFPNNTVLSLQSLISIKFSKILFYTPYINVSVLYFNDAITNDVVLLQLNSFQNGIVIAAITPFDIIGKLNNNILRKKVAI